MYPRMWTVYGKNDTLRDKPFNVDSQGAKMESEPP